MGAVIRLFPNRHAALRRRMAGMGAIHENVLACARQQWCLCCGMRRIFLSAALIPLLAGLLLLQRDRFERVPGGAMIGLADLKAMASALPEGAAWVGGPEAPALRLEAANGRLPLAFKIGLPVARGHALHVRMRMKADQLTRGPEKWQDGRVLVEWFAADGSSAGEVDTVGSVRGNEDIGGLSLVLRPSSESLVPALRVEHLGSGGGFSVSQLEFTPVKERTVWKIGKWCLLVAWFVWLSVALGTVSHKRLIWRHGLTAAIWLGMGVWFVFPGPWKTQRPMVIPFDLGPPIELAQTARHAGLAPTPDPVRKHEAPPPAAAEPLGRIHSPENWILSVRRVFEFGRPLLHVLLLFCPTFAFAWLSGAKRALVLGCSLALACEAAQTGFGYGFDWIDVLDLACDAAGIALALHAYDRMRRNR